jgi:hypothetical protein
VITTASHHFFDRDCQRVDIPGTCYFQQLGSQKKYLADITTLKSDCVPHRGKGDWAVVKLKKPVSDGRFYRVPESDVELRVGEITMVVSSSQINFKVGEAYPPSVQNCEIKEVTSYGIFLHDCDTGGGSSGSAHLANSDAGRTLVGINVGFSAEDSAQRPIPDGEPFNIDHHYNISIPVAGELLKAIKELAGIK